MLFDKVICDLKSVTFKKKLTRLFFILLGVTLVYQTGRTFFLKQEWQARNRAYEMVKRLFPDAWDRACDQYGLFCFNGSEKPMQKCTGVVESGCIILIHGLDDPGFTFETLALALHRKGYPVLFFFYPDDQRIDASSQLLFNNLSSLSLAGPVVLVGHSMGGLVARHMLVDPVIDYAGARARTRVPEIRDLIMVGTPNHGAFLSRFRLFMEIREQCLLAFDHRWHMLSGFIDGTGAAGIDLLPQSEFMRHLNSLPYPGDIPCHIIAGHIFAFPVNMPEQFQITGNQTLEGVLLSKKNDFRSMLDKAGLLIGDGLVSINSAVSFDVPVTLVKGNHKTMLAHCYFNGSRIPPAVSVILDILAHHEN